MATYFDTNVFWLLFCPLHSSHFSIFHFVIDLRYTYCCSIFRSWRVHYSGINKNNTEGKVMIYFEIPRFYTIYGYLIFRRWKCAGNGCYPLCLGTIECFISGKVHSQRCFLEQYYWVTAYEMTFSFLVLFAGSYL